MLCRLPRLDRLSCNRLGNLDAVIDQRRHVVRELLHLFHQGGGLIVRLGQKRLFQRDGTLVVFADKLLNGGDALLVVLHHL